MSLSEIFFQLEKKDKETIKIAYLVIDYCNKHNIEITNLKLIKLLYFINIEYMLKNNGIPIFEEEFLAWRHGPVLQKGDNISSTDYTYDNIVKILFYYDQKGDLLKKFNSMLVLDALFGEGDRHHENWGLYKDESTNEKYDFLPIYDNSSCLLHQLREEQILKKFILSKDMQSYVKKSKSKITIGGKKYTHFEFIDYLLENLPNEFKNDLQKNIENLNKLTDDYIYKLINRIPCDVCSMEHKNLIIQYIIIRRDLLLSKVV